MNGAWALALRDMRGGLKGLRLLILCLFLGVAGLAGVGSLARAITAELDSRGQEILGGDIEMRVAQREAAPDERTAFARLGTVSETVRLRAMASRADATASVLAELKSVDDRWPLYGSLTVAPGAIAARPAGLDAIVAPALAERLSLAVGDRVRVGETSFRVAGLIADEPDRVGEGFTLGPSILVSRAGLAATKLVQPGSLFTARYRIRLPADRDAHAVAERLDTRFHDANWEVSDRTNAARGLRRFVDQLGQFLTLVGLTALVVAGIGVGNGVASWLDQRRPGIATLKILGASSATIVRIYLIQVAIVSTGAIAGGLIVGAAVPAIVGALAGDALPVAPKFAIFPLPLLISAVYGLLAALLFSLSPLARAGQVSPAAIFRARIEPFGWPRWRVLLPMAAAGLGIALLAIATAREPMLSAGFLAATAGIFALLGGIGWLVRRGAGALPRPRRPLLRLAIANLHRPAAQTDRLIVALGLGLTLFVLLAVLQTNLASQIEKTVPAIAPNFFALDVPTEDIDRFRSTILARAPEARIDSVPSLRGSVVAVRGVRVTDMKPIPKGAWILNGDRGLTYSARLSEGNEIVAGKWWPADYAGPPLVSIEEQAAASLNLKPGDTMTLSVLGVEIEATVASIRRVNWETMGFNFGIVFAPGALEGAPHSYMATIAIPDARETAVNRAVIGGFPSVSLIRVKDVVGQVATIFGQLATAIRAAASVALAAGVAVLVGAVAASRRARLYDAVLLKLLGANRRQILGAQAIEYALLAAIIAVVALAAGTGAGWYVVTRIFELHWAPDWTIVFLTLGLGALGTLAIGLLGSLPVLAARPAEALRSL
ncbi:MULTISPECIES: ABC transporter permease [unclassified Sphingomonas]|uniref:ABC transporter permease n=1 Tax=unclassified Sphingomonas TaxID=196159 RepID=UPI0007017382|nr:MULTISPECIES: FtsX-like permease family protein [unclassified Sphingomonas]KQX20146.1 ABC transporter permease [Sphingomonas sp. Root1294]KQY67396.1 ABC transporter permease [Sphingomonas sp. Root50]KRB90773.1 ABC transporter permease [Sphingomonas sp. Root720]